MSQSLPSSSASDCGSMSRTVIPSMGSTLAASNCSLTSAFIPLRSLPLGKSITLPFWVAGSIPPYRKSTRRGKGPPPRPQKLQPLPQTRVPPYARFAAASTADDPGVRISVVTPGDHSPDGFGGEVTNFLGLTTEEEIESACER